LTLGVYSDFKTMKLNNLKYFTLMVLFISDISQILFQQGCQMSQLLIILFQQRCQMSTVFLSDNAAINIIKLLIFLFQQRCQTFCRNRDLGPHHRVGSDDDPATRGHAADQDDADHLSLFCGETFQLMFLQMELTFCKSYVECCIML
jgi:hypothetical protein